MHSTNNLEDGYLGSGKRLWYSINYHGKENHTKEILEFCENREQLKKRETEIVNEQLISEELCMNLKTGGEGGIINEEHSIKLKEGASRYQKGKWLSDDEYRTKITSILYDGMKKHHENRTDYITFNGKVHSEETKKKMSEKAKQRTGEKNSQYGTCWITKNGENKKIKKELLTVYQVKGWTRGRK